jgi:hypothetical protein
VALYYTKIQEPTENPRIFHERVLRQSGTQNLTSAKRAADKIVNGGGRAFVEEYGKGCIYTPKMKDIWLSPSK